MLTQSLEELRTPLETALSTYEQLCSESIRFQRLPNFTLTSEKPNYARTIVPMSNGTTLLGEMYVIIFLPHDGTGDNKTYTKERLIIPPKYQFTEKPEKVFPRAKTGIICEGFFPLFSIDKNGNNALFTASLEELTINTETSEINAAWTLGLSTSEYHQAFNKDLQATPRVTYTTGTRNNTRFGDPHAIYNATDIVQVVGFLGIKDKDNPLMRLTDQWNFPF